MPVTFAYTTQFSKQFKQLPSHLQTKLRRQLTYLAQDMRHPSLHAKKMAGKSDIWEARVDYHYRFTFQIRSGIIVLRAVGTHQIYRS